MPNDPKLRRVYFILSNGYSVVGTILTKELPVPENKFFDIFDIEIKEPKHLGSLSSLRINTAHVIAYTFLPET